MKSALAILIGALALLIGYFSHRAINPSANTYQQVRTDDGSSSTRTIHSQRRSLERAMRTPESTQRWLRVVALLEKATVNDMQGIAEAVGFSVRRVTKMIGQHWFDLNPQHLFDTSFNEMNLSPRGESANFACYSYISLLAEKWPQQNLNAAIAAFSQADPKFLLSDYRSELIDHLVKVNLGEAIKLSKIWGCSLRDGYGFLKKTVEDDPVKAAHAILSQYQTNKLHLHRDPFNPYQYTYEGEPLIRILAETWGKSDPINALAFASSFKTNQGEYLQKGILEQWARLDDVAAGHWLDQQAQEIQDKYRPTLIKAWAT